MKLHPWHLDRLLPAASIAEVFPAPTFVRLSRQDLLGQAISLDRAQQTGSYHSHIAAARNPAFDADRIEQLMRALAANRARWNLYFARNGIVPVQVSYEELRADPLGVVLRIAKRAGEPVRRRDLATIQPIRPQADAVSDEWRDRYLRERGSLDRFDPILHRRMP